MFRCHTFETLDSESIPSSHIGLPINVADTNPKMTHDMDHVCLFPDFFNLIPASLPKVSG